MVFCQLFSCLPWVSRPSFTPIGETLTEKTDNVSVPATEVLNSIFRIADPQDVKRSCLVSQSFHQADCAHVFSQVILESGRNCAALSKLLHEKPEISSYIRGLEIITAGNDELPKKDWATLYYDDLAYILGKVSPSIIDFAYQTGHQSQSLNQLPLKLQSALTDLVTKAPHLTSVSLSFLSFPVQFFSDTPQLRSLRLSHVKMPEDLAGFDHREPSAKESLINTLELDSCSDGVLETLSTSLGLSNLRELSLTGHPYDNGMVGDVLKRSRNSLQTLTWGEIAENSELPAIGEMPWIETLHLGPSSPEDPDNEAWRWLITSLEKGPDVHGLAELVLEGFRSKPPRYNLHLEDDELWGLLDKLLMQPKFRELRQVTLKVPVTMVEWRDYGDPAVMVYAKTPLLLTAGKIKAIMM